MKFIFLYTDFYYLIPELYFLVNFIIIFIYSIFFSNINVYKYTRIAKPISSLFILLFFLYALLILNNIDYNFIISYYFFVNNELLIFLKCFFIFLSIIILISFFSFMNIFDVFFFEFIFLFALSCFGMLLLMMSYDFILIYLSIELQSLCFYILIAMQKKKNKAVEASLKYFILGSFSSAIFLLGIGFVYGSSGITNVKDLSLLFNFELNLFTPSDFFMLFGFFLISIGFFFKLSIAPFHFWLPDVFDGSSKLIIMIFGTLPKFSLFFLFFKLYYILFSQYFLYLQYFFLCFVVLSWLIGLFGAIQTNKLNKFLAYSSINHLGFILLSLTIHNLFSFVFYIFIYLIISLNIFLINCCLIKYNNNSELTKIEQLVYIVRSNQIIFINFFICLFSLAGLPPLAGFFGKFFIFLNSINYNLFFITFLGLLISLASCFYYLRIVKNLTFNNTKNYIFLINVDKSISYLLSLGLMFNIIFIYYLPFFFNFIKFLIFSII